MGKRGGDVEWRLPNKRKPFAYSTKAESNTICVLLEEFGSMDKILESKCFINDNERVIIQAFVDAGILNPRIEFY